MNAVTRIRTKLLEDSDVDRARVVEKRHRIRSRIVSTMTRAMSTKVVMGCVNVTKKAVRTMRIVIAVRPDVREERRCQKYRKSGIPKSDRYAGRMDLNPYEKRRGIERRNTGVT